MIFSGNSLYQIRHIKLSLIDDAKIHVLQHKNNTFCVNSILK